MTTTRREIGQWGEQMAADYLAGKGYRIIERNWCCAGGELDIIAAEGERLVFVEVRTRRGGRFGSAAESVTPAKQNRLIELAQTYLQEKTETPPAWRIDVVAIQLGPGRTRLNHIENAVGW